MEAIRGIVEDATYHEGIGWVIPAAAFAELCAVFGVEPCKEDARRCRQDQKKWRIVNGEPQI